MTSLTTAQKLLILLVVWFLLNGHSGGAAPPYAASKPTVLIVEDESAEGRAKLTGEQDDIMRSLAAGGVRKSVEAAAGELRVLGHSNAVDYEADWVKAAWAVADKTSLPSIVAASPTAGVKPQPLPQTVAEAKALLAPLGVK